MKRVVMPLLVVVIAAMPFGIARRSTSQTAPHSPPPTPPSPPAVHPPASTPNDLAALPPVRVASAVTRPDTISHATAVAAATTTAGGSIAGRLSALVHSRRARAEERRRAARRALREGQAGTYIADILNERDSSIARWPDRRGVPLTVWIQPQSTVTDFTPSLVSRVREAFDEWNALDLPIHFAFADDSADAEVHVRWIDHFTRPISGRTRWSRDEDWVITDANILLAVHHSAGDALDQSSMRAMALHEIGHLLGLDHTRDATSIMAPMVRARRLSEADRATVRLVYSLPAGPLR